MQRANPAELRKAMESANVMMRAGILFVAMPVLDEQDLATMRGESIKRLERIIEITESEEEPRTK
ncbi:DUF1382 family protein [Stutzerimonas stutzeri]|uniref:Uncharacterized protein n=1 Tax=Stutzerimonas stutzeri TaxID=316 RepID=A0A172WRB9_STUST|nr:DUF1382 family protein [Stutzerimonas stutzeri]ANF26002.1 hypothetical protein PS273GM_13040 [Stutzerimonas stutzeri]